MTNHYDEMRVSPDPSQAEELRRRLHARMSNIPTDDHRGRSALEAESGDRPDEWIPLANEFSPPDPSTTNQRTHRRRAMVAAVAVVAIAAAGIGSRIGDPSPVDTVAPPPTTPTSAGANDPCPLTAEDVSDVLGAVVTGPESATVCYFDGGTGIIPSASFFYQPPSACTQESLNKDGYLDYTSLGAVDGLGVNALAHRSSFGVTVRVCNGDQPFDVHVEFEGDSEAAAVELAKLVLGG